MRRALSTIFLCVQLCSCSASLPDIKIQDNDVTGQVSGVAVAISRIEPQRRFKDGKRVTVLRASLFIRERTSLRKQDVEIGDDLVIGTSRFTVVDVEQGTPPDKAGFVVFRPGS